MRSGRPDRSEAAEYYFRYIDQVPDGDIRETLASQRDEMRELFGTIAPERAASRYEEGKWTLGEVVGHLSDTERLFEARAMWFARSLPGQLPSFDPDAATAAANFTARSWRSLIDEQDAVRGATICLFADLPDEVWDRGGIASGNPFTVRALAWLAAGHVNHHLVQIRERYLRLPR